MSADTYGADAPGFDTSNINVSGVHKKAISLIEGACRVIRGKREFLELLAAGIFAGGHILLEDYPGLGKTTVAKTIARLITGENGTPLIFKRIQFTPDLLPYDITGVDIFDPQNRSFRFMPGPVLANIVLADEINRTTPKVQSALLEVMADGQVTIGDATHKPPEPFFVLATENPVESEGTFPLPAAQLDRFMMRLSLGYPDRESELMILEENPAGRILESLSPVMTAGDFMEIRGTVKKIFCHPSLKEAAADIVRDTRIHRSFSLGVSPRGALHYLEAAKALALVRGRNYITDEDLLVLAIPVLGHRTRIRDTGGAVTAEKRLMEKHSLTRTDTVIREIALARLERITNEN